MYAGIRDAVIFFLSGIVESTRKCRLIYGNQIEIDRSYPPWMFSVFLYGEWKIEGKISNACQFCNQNIPTRICMKAQRFLDEWHIHAYLQFRILWSYPRDIAKECAYFLNNPPAILADLMDLYLLLIGHNSAQWRNFPRLQLLISALHPVCLCYVRECVCARYNKLLFFGKNQLNNLWSGESGYFGMTE